MSLLVAGTSIASAQTATESYFQHYRNLGWNMTWPSHDGVVGMGMDLSGRTMMVNNHGFTRYMSTNGITSIDNERLPLFGHQFLFANDGSFFVFGHTNHSVTTDGIIFKLEGRFVAKYNPARRLLWAANLRNDPQTPSPAVGAPLPNGGVVTSVAIQGSTLLSALNSEGELAWFRRLTNFVAKDIAVDSTGRITVAGTFSTATTFVGNTLVPRGGDDVAVLQLEPDGADRWAKQLGGPLFDAVVGLALDGEGRVIVASKFVRRTIVDGLQATANGSAGIDIGLLAFTADGQVQWLTAVGGAGDEDAQGLVADRDGNAYLAYTQVANPSQPGRPILAKFDPSGSLVWTRRFNAESADQESRLVFTHLACDGSGNLAAIATVGRGNSVWLTPADREIVQVPPEGFVAVSVPTTNPERVEDMDLAISTYAGLTITGKVGRTYRVEHRSNLDDSHPWVALDEVTLATSPQIWFDAESKGRSRGFYRVVLLP
ncbi:MAG: hypothetical protein JNK85_16890 [Verrucomicrobiales bacterium]|nr:hypothetical protein [Verrucomicrobiales bacterium]